MAIDKVLTPEIKAMVGNQSKPQEAVDEVTTSEVRRWVIATMDDNPLWHDKEYANKTRFGPNCAPGPFPMRSVGHWKRRMGTPDPVRQLDFDDDFRYGDESLDDPAVKIPWPEGVGAFHGGNEVEFFQFPKVGDRVQEFARIVSMAVKTGRSGRLVVVNIDHIYANQRGEVLIIDHYVEIAREMPGDQWKGRRT